jgi:hypothetical protein
MAGFKKRVGNLINLVFNLVNKEVLVNCCLNFVLLICCFYWLNNSLNCCLTNNHGFNLIFLLVNLNYNLILQFFLNLITFFFKIIVLVNNNPISDSEALRIGLCLIGLIAITSFLLGKWLERKKYKKEVHLLKEKLNVDKDNSLAILNIDSAEEDIKLRLYKLELLKDSFHEENSLREENSFQDED